MVEKGAKKFKKLVLAVDAIIEADIDLEDVEVRPELTLEGLDPSL